MHPMEAGSILDMGPLRLVLEVRKLVLPERRKIYLRLTMVVTAKGWGYQEQHLEIRSLLYYSWITC